MKKQDSPALQLKKQTLTAWARILNRRGLIDSARLGRMITMIGQMTESGMKKSAGKSG
ncbi:MAG: hypothetical protein IKI58_05510 [Oscillospiraceae bacterium]|nr:hypothetical protein [Oscillospiraceae bacterium]